MKPLNLDNSPCSPISSNCVIWQGPDIPCIKLCQGDTVSDVVHSLATELCTIIDTLNISNYDLSCFNLTSCAPGDFQALINFLIQQICDSNNISPVTPPASGGCPNDCFVTVADCLGGGIDTLTNYVNTIAEKICDLIEQISIQQLQLDSLQTQVDNLTITVAGLSNYVTPTVSLSCDIGTLVAPGIYGIDVIIDEFVNVVWCPMNDALVGVGGTPANLVNAVAAQCTTNTDPALSVQYTNPLQTISAEYASWILAPTSIADTINNLWIALCDVRNIELMQYQVTTSDDITLTTSVVGAMTTFDIGRTPKEWFYDSVSTLINVSSDPGFVDLVYFMPLPYTALQYTNTSGTTKDYLVKVSYDTKVEYNPLGSFIQNSMSNWVEGAITKNGVTVLHESGGLTNFSVVLADSVTNTVITPSTPETVVTTPSGNPVNVSLSNAAKMPINTSFFAAVTLNNGESVQLKFKSKAGQISWLVKAQFFVEEIR